MNLEKNLVTNELTEAASRVRHKKLLFGFATYLLIIIVGVTLYQLYLIYRDPVSGKLKPKENYGYKKQFAFLGFMLCLIGLTPPFYALGIIFTAFGKFFTGIFEIFNVFLMMMVSFIFLMFFFWPHY